MKCNVSLLLVFIGQSSRCCCPVGGSNKRGAKIPSHLGVYPAIGPTERAAHGLDLRSFECTVLGEFWLHSRSPQVIFSGEASSLLQSDVSAARVPMQPALDKIKGLLMLIIQTGEGKLKEKNKFPPCRERIWWLCYLIISILVAAICFFRMVMTPSKGHQGSLRTLMSMNHMPWPSQARSGLKAG